MQLSLGAVGLPGVSYRRWTEVKIQSPRRLSYGAGGRVKGGTTCHTRRLSHQVREQFTLRSTPPEMFILNCELKPTKSSLTN